MKAVLVNADGSITYETVADPTPEAGEVIVRVGAAGICGTDLHIIDREIQFADLPVIPGHELAGTVVALGEGVTNVAEGDRVAVAPGVFCGVCRFCRRGRFNLCEAPQGIGITRNGGAAEFVSVPAANCHLIPDSMSMAAAALVEPLSCALHGFDLLPRQTDDRYLVYGAGTMGLLMTGLAANSGTGGVDVVDTDANRLLAASAVGAKRVATSADEFNETYGWDTVIDCTGAPAAIEDGLSRVDRGGTFQNFGVARGDATVSYSPFRVYHDELTILGSMAVLNSFDRAIAVMASGRIDVDLIVSHQLPLSEYAEAVSLFRARVGGKLMVLSWVTERTRQYDPQSSGTMLADENLLHRPYEFVSDESPRTLDELRAK
jgi:2-desacetyl-2-hydroxyethyl bacteriochlorophyllide A dehydrogenase